MSVKYGLLGILARKPQHGYELKRSFEQLTGGFWELNYGQIYQTLDRLEHDGHVTHSVERDAHVPDKKVYDITLSGREALQAWLEQPEPRARPLRDELFIRLAVMSRGDIGHMLDLIAKHQALYLEKMRELTQNKAALQERRGADAAEALVEGLLIDAALYHAEADVKWLEHCETMLSAYRRERAN